MGQTPGGATPFTSLRVHVVGTVSVVPQGEALYLRSLAVLPRARGRRLGEALVRPAEEYARANGLQRLLLSTTPVLTGAIR